MIKVRNLQVKAGDFLLSCPELDVKKGEYFMLLGPMGAGKTIFLESIAGVRGIESGEVFIGSKDVTMLGVEHRNIGIVYQKKMLFPHLCVRDNIIFGLKVRKIKKKEIQEALAWVCGLLDVEHLLDRKPEGLSGGEQQKVALARTIITKPDVLLLDEPLSALDPQNKDMMQGELRKLSRKLGITIIHVTHDFNEAVTLGSRVAILGGGEFHQIGSPKEVFTRPASEFVARFTMAGNILKGSSKESEGEAFFSTNGLTLKLAGSLQKGSIAVIRSEEIILTKEKTDKPNCIKGKVEALIRRAQTTDVLFLAGGVKLHCALSHREVEELKIEEGEDLFVLILPSSIHIID